MKALVCIFLYVLPLNLMGEEVHTIEAIWNQGHYIEFEDGSVWYIDWWNSWNSWHWHQDERVQYSKSSEGDLLLNLDQPDSRAHVVATLCPPRENFSNRHFIAEILENGELIKLENGFCWNLVAPFSGFGGFFGDVTKEEYLQHIQEKWSIGDEVALDVWREKEAGFVSYVLTNMRAGSVPVRFCSEQMTFRSHHIEEVNWFSITLDDGSSWELEEFVFAFAWGWNKGDPVILYNTDRRDPARHLLVHCNAAPRTGKYVFVKSKNERACDELPPESSKIRYTRLYDDPERQ